MTTHTPGPISGFYDDKTCYQCGCFASNAGIELCPIHAAARRMLEFIRALGMGVHQSKDAMESWKQSARAILREVEGS